MKDVVMAFALGCAVAVGFASINSARAAAGEEWEYQSSMEMMGMKMPMGAVKACTTPNQNTTPPMDGNCKFSNITKQGNTTKFDFVCPPPTASKGSGSMTIAGDKADAKYSIESEEVSGDVIVTGKKLGACDTEKYSTSVNGKSIDSMMSNFKK